MKKFNEVPIYFEDPFDPSNLKSITCHIFIDESYRVFEYYRINDLSDIANINPYVLDKYQDKEHRGFIEPVNLIKCFYYSEFAIGVPILNIHDKPLMDSQIIKDFALKLMQLSINVHWHQQSKAYSTYIDELALGNDKKSFDDCFN